MFFGVLPKPSSHPMLFIIAVAPKSCRSAVLVGKLSRACPEDPWFPKQHFRQTTSTDGCGGGGITARSQPAFRHILSHRFDLDYWKGNRKTTIPSVVVLAENTSPLGNIDLIDSSTAISVAQMRHRNEQTSTRSAMAVAQMRHSAARRRPSRRPAVPLFGCFWLQYSHHQMPTICCGTAQTMRCYDY